MATDKDQAEGSIRNKEKSKQKFLDAVGVLIKENGYESLKINDIAFAAGLDKKLIYRYFGGTEQLFDAYIQSQDFWSNVKGDQFPAEINDGGRLLMKNMLLSQFEYVSRNKELQKILLWRLSQPRKSLKKLTDDQEENGEKLLTGITDPFFGKNATKFRAISAILVSGMYYLNLYSELNGSIFCGIDLKTEQGRSHIEEALLFLIDQSYDHL